MQRDEQPTEDPSVPTIPYPHPFSLDGRVAVITGAASGIGRQSALVLRQAGASVALADRDQAGLDETAALLATAPGGGSVTTHVVDVGEREQVEGLATAVGEHHGRLDIWANVAGILRYGTILDADPDDLEAVTRVNQFGTYWGVAAAARAMGDQGGAIVNISSSGADMPAPTLSIYAMTKAAVAHLTRCAAAELGPLGIRVNAVAPGFIDTPMVAGHWTGTDGQVDEDERATVLSRRATQSLLRTVGQPDDIAWAVLYLASDASRFMTGQVLRPNGGVFMS